MYPLFRYLATPQLSVLLFVTLLFQVTVHGQSDPDTFGIFPPAPIDGAPEVKESIPVTEEVTDENFVKGVMEVFPQAPSEKCECVPFYLCNDDNTINTDGTGVIDIRFGGECNNFYHKCCKSSKDPDTMKINTEDNRLNCGHWNSQGAGWRITGDVNNEAQFGEFPWMVAILKIDPVPNHTYVCGASLIHPAVVLTAVHCIYDKQPEDLLIRAGEWDTKTELEQIPHQDRSIYKIIKHEKYYAGAVHNDIALIFLTEKFILRDNVGTVCLPPQGYQFHSERCFVSGWGKNASTTGRSYYQNILKKIDVPIVSRHTCLELLRQTRLGHGFKLHESFMCAGGEIGKDACKGDGGSPLACPVSQYSDQYHQAGIVAWGIGCGDKTPGVYVDVSQFRDWIDQHMDEEQKDKSYYDSEFKVPAPTLTV